MPIGPHLACAGQSPELKTCLREEKTCARAEAHFRLSQASIASRRAEKLLVPGTIMPRLLPFSGHTVSYGICSHTPILAAACLLHKRGGSRQIWRLHAAQYIMPIAASMGHMEGAGVQVRSSSC